MSRVLILGLYLTLLSVALAGAAFAVLDYIVTSRGIEPAFPPAARIIGTNVALEQYTTDAELQRAFDLLKRAGITHVRQYFPWREIEPRRGEYAWARWDRIVRAAQVNGVQLVAVLHTAPAWSQRENERAMPGAPPADFQDYARFVGAFARRYGDAIDFYQVWDEPNVAPNWGQRNADPVEYAQLLIPASEAIRANDPTARVLLAGLAMNLELHRPHPYYSEILFLRGLYEIGAHKYFDIVAAKPYGMWSGPEDRTVNSSVLNFSRLILLRDEMHQYGDASKPVWIVEMGWNALPPNWEGQVSPWGTDSIETQTDRLARGLARIQSEWAWVTGVFPLSFQPDAAADDPRWGFALRLPDASLRPFYNTLAAFIAAPPPRVPPPSLPWLPVALLGSVALVAAGRAWHWMLVLRLDERWRQFQARVRALPEWLQFAVLLAAAAAFFLSPSTLLNFVLVAVLVVLFALRLDLGLLLTIFVIPFWNYPKALFGGFLLSPVESLTWVAAAAFVLDAALSRRWSVAARAAAQRSALSSLDWSVLAFLLLGLVSTRWAGNFGVASREFRIIVLDPILLYALVRLTRPSSWQVRRMVGALLASGVAVCAIGLYQFATGDVIQADGVARLTAVWGSPNNVALYLGRLVPLALAFALLLRGDAWRGIPVKWLYAALVVLFGLTIFLTYSRGALFFGVPASVLCLLVILFTRAHPLSRRGWILLGAAAVVALLAAGAVLTTERGQSLFQTGTGTGFFRLAVWTSAVNMIRDHPLLGVGLDNFLYEYPKYILPEAWREPNLSHPHDVWLDFWVRLGVLGVVILAWMLVAFYRRAWRGFTTTRSLYARALLLGLMASMVDFLAHGLIDAAYFVIDLAYVFMLTLALAQEREGLESRDWRLEIRD